MAINKTKKQYIINNETFSSFIDNHQYDQEDAGIRITVSLFQTMLERIAAKYSSPDSLEATNKRIKTMFIEAIEEAFQINDEAIRHNMDDKSEILLVYEELFRHVHEELDNRRIISTLLTDDISTTL